MFKEDCKVMECSLDNTLHIITTYCLESVAEQNDAPLSKVCQAAGQARLEMDFIQQEDTEFAWVDEFNTQGLVCTFKLNQHVIMHVSESSLNLQRLKWQLIFPADSVDDILKASNTELLNTAIFRRVTQEFDDSIVDDIETAIAEMVC